MASTLVALQTVTVGSGGASSISFTNIPQTYKDLQVVISGRLNGTSAGTSIAFNNDTNNFSYKHLYAFDSTVGSGGGNVNYVYESNTSNMTASTFDNSQIYIPNYTGSTNKSYSVDAVSENNSTSLAIRILLGGVWSKTDPITTVTVAPYSGAFVQYSTATLYGVYNSPLDTAVEAPTIGTATAASTGANVAFTPSGTGAPATSYVATSSPGGITATGTTSPILVTGLTSGTAYTFTVKGQNPGGTGAASAASNSVTPYDGYESIATAYGSGGSTLTFSSIPSTYTHLQIRVMSLTSATAPNAILRFNSDTGSNYTAHQLYGSGSVAGSNIPGSGSNPQTSIPVAQLGSSTQPGVGVVDILDYANTNKYKTIRSLSGYDANGSGYIILRSGAWMSTSAVTSITLLTDSGNFNTNSVFELYGIRG